MKTRKEIMKKAHQIARTLEGNYIVRLSEGLKNAWKWAKSANNYNIIQTWKEIALSVNDKWNSNSTWKLAEIRFGELKTNKNEFIESLLDSMFMRNRLSEKQAYYLAKYAVETGQLD